MIFFSWPIFAQENSKHDDAYHKHKALADQNPGVNILKDREAFFSYYFEQSEILLQIENHPVYVLDVLYHWGFYFLSYKLPKESIKNYKWYLDFYEKHKESLSDDDKKLYFERTIKAHSFLANVYSKDLKLDSAKIYHDLSIEHSKKNNSIFYMSALNNYGLYYYWNKKDLDSAMIYFDKVFEIMKVDFSNDALIGSVRDNIADIYVEKGYYKQANQLYVENFSFYEQKFNDRLDAIRLVRAGVQSIQTDLKLRQLKRAEQHFNKLDKLVHDDTLQLLKSTSIRLDYLTGKAELLHALGETTQAFEIAQLTRKLSDSVNRVTLSETNQLQNDMNEFSMKRIKYSYELERLQKNNLIERQRANIWIILLSSLLVLVVLVLLFIKRRQRIINARNKQKLAEYTASIHALKNQQLNEEIEAKKRDLSDFAINLNQNQEWAKTLIDKWKALKLTKGRKRKLLSDEFENEINNKIKFDKDTATFYARLDELSDSFYRQLNKQFPDLSKTDKRLCSLIRLKIESRKIATLQNITISSLNTSRYRLRKKLNLSKEEDLDDFIQSL